MNEPPRSDRDRACAKISAPATSRPHSSFRTECRRSAESSRENEPIIAGTETAAEVFRRVDPELKIADPPAGRQLRSLAAKRFSKFAARPARILIAERVALNFLQRLSGIATLTRQFVDAIGEIAREDSRYPKNDAGIARAGKSGGRGRRRSKPSLRLERHGPGERQSLERGSGLSELPARSSACARSVRRFELKWRPIASNRCARLSKSKAST